MNSNEIKALLLTPRAARKGYRSLEAFMQAKLVGQTVTLAHGAVIEVSSVVDAGFNGLQVLGRDAAGAIKMGYYR